LTENVFKRISVNSNPNINPHLNTNPNSNLKKPSALLFMQIVINKCFLLNIKKNLVQI